MFTTAKMADSLPASMHVWCVEVAVARLLSAGVSAAALPRYALIVLVLQIFRFVHSVKAESHDKK